MKNKTNIFSILIILWLCLIFGHSFMPASVSSSESGFVTDIILKIIPSLENAENVGHLVRKAAHFTEFFILAALLSLRLRGLFNSFIKRFAVVAASGLFAAFIDETIQIFVEGRGSSVADMWVDFAGVVTGCLITLGVAGLVSKRSCRKPGTDR